MKMGSWNVNGLRACMKKGFMDFFNNCNFDIIGLQETKMYREQANFVFDGYHQFWNSAQKKGYSGTAIFCKQQPLSATYGIGIAEHDTEGRVITLEFDNFYFVTVYTPNAKQNLLRLPYRMEWENAFREYLIALKKPVVVCGDLNVAHNEIDLKNPKNNHKTPGFSPEERGKMTELLNAGFTDTFRYKNPNATDAYTWWSYISNARANNTGWRIDYFLVTNSLQNFIQDVIIYDQIMGSDHCPVGLTLSL
ncbi:MAG: exodeoxyribonuclease III [Firmicutes bacterium]|nr:exodeoxyribonuclease III [Bacillota bacterium]